MKILSTIGAFVFAAFLAAACSSTTTSTPSGSPGISNMQGGKCLDQQARCEADADCCSGFCANYRCTARNPNGG